MFPLYKKKNGNGVPMRSRPTRTLQYAYVMYNTVGLA